MLTHTDSPKVDKIKRGLSIHFSIPRIDLMRTSYTCCSYVNTYAHSTVAKLGKRSSQLSQIQSEHQSETGFHTSFESKRSEEKTHHFLISHWLFLAPIKVHILLLHHHKNLIRVTHTEGPTQATLHPSHGTYHIGNSIPPLIAVIAAF